MVISIRSDVSAKSLDDTNARHFHGRENASTTGDNNDRG
jgi:hypothetical protein